MFVWFSNIYTPMSFACNDATHKKTVAFIFQWKTPITSQKNWYWFFQFLGVICHLSTNIRIAVHFFSFALGNEKTLVGCKSLTSASRDLHVTIVLSFPNAKYTWAPQTVHNTPVMNILKSYYYIILFWKKCIKVIKWTSNFNFQLKSRCM